MNGCAPIPTSPPVHAISPATNRASSNSNSRRAPAPIRSSASSAPSAASPTCRDFVAAHPNTNYVNQDYNTAELPANLDAVVIVLYYHDLSLNNIDIAEVQREGCSRR